MAAIDSLPLLFEYIIMQSVKIEGVLEKVHLADAPEFQKQHHFGEI